MGEEEEGVREEEREEGRSELPYLCTCMSW